MAVFCTGATVPTPVYRWYKYSADSETITTKTYNAGRTILSVASGSTSSVSYGGAQVAVSPTGISDGSQYGLDGYAGESDSTTFTVAAGKAWTLTLNLNGITTNGASLSGTDTASGPAADSDITFKFDLSVSTSMVYASVSVASGSNPVVVTLDTPLTEYSQGDTYYGVVESEDEGAYPNGGHQDGYWYVRMGAA